MSKPSLLAQIQALLFVANEPLSTSRLAELTGHKESEVRQALTKLTTHLTGSGLALTSLNDHYRLVTTPEADPVVRRYLEAGARSDLSKPALETLAIIAYRGPITRAALDEIRGVASEVMLRNLLQRGLISEQGSAAEPGKPTLYGVSHTFLQHFGLSSLTDLPQLQETTET